MITIHLTGNANDVQKAAFVLQQLFEGVQVEQGDSPSKQDTDIHLRLVAQNLPGNNALIELLKIAPWQTAMKEIRQLAGQPIVSLEQLKRLDESIEAASQLAGEFDEIGETIINEVLEAQDEIERIKEAAVGYILNAAHPALKSE